MKEARWICPQCGSFEELFVESRCVLAITQKQDGSFKTIDASDTEWGCNSIMKCVGCEHTARAREFAKKGDRA